MEDDQMAIPAHMLLSKMTKNNDNSSLARRLVSNSVWSFSAYVVLISIGIISVPVYVHFLGIEHYGLLILLGSVLVPVGLLNAGFGQATIKYVAESIGREDKAETGTYVRTTLIINVGFGLLGALLIIALAGFLTTQVFKISASDQQLAQTGFLWIALTWLITQVSVTFRGIPAALQNYAVVSMGTTLVTAVNVIVGVLVLVAGGDLLAVIQVRFVWAVVATGLWIWLATGLLPGISFWPRWHSTAFRRSFSFASWQSLANIGGAFAQQTDIYVLGAFLSPSAVGVYSIAKTLVVTVSSGLYKIGDVLFPAVSQLDGSGQRQRAGFMMMRSSWFLSILSVVLLGSVGVFAHDILRLYLDAQTADSASRLLQIFVVAALLSIASIAPYQYLLGFGRTTWTAAASFGSGLVVLIASLILIPRFGVNGAGWGQILMVLLTRPLLHFLLWREDLRPAVSVRTFFAHLYGPAVTGVVVVTILSVLRSQLIWQPGWLATIMGLFICALVLLVLVFVTNRFMPGSAGREADAARLFGFGSGIVRKAIRAPKDGLGIRIQNGRKEAQIKYKKIKN